MSDPFKRGEANYAAFLTEDHVRELRQLRVAVKDVNKVSDDMGLTVVNEVLVNGYQVNGSLRSVQGFNGSVNKDMVSCKQAFGDLQKH